MAYAPQRNSVLALQPSILPFHMICARLQYFAQEFHRRQETLALRLKFYLFYNVLNL
jgi:hypothetical protein